MTLRKNMEEPSEQLKALGFWHTLVAKTMTHLVKNPTASCGALMVPFWYQLAQPVQHVLLYLFRSLSNIKQTLAGDALFHVHTSCQVDSSHPWSPWCSRSPNHQLHKEHERVLHRGGWSRSHRGWEGRRQMGNLNLSAMGPTNSHNDPQCILHPSIWYYYLPTSFRRQKKARTFDPQHVGVYKTHRHDPFIAKKAFQTVPVHPSCRHILRQWVPPANDPGADSVLELSARYGFQFVRSCTIHEIHEL